MNWIIQFLIWLRLLVAGWINPPYKTIVVQALLPEKLKRKSIYIVQEDDFEEQAAMLCPRCRDHILHMNLLTDERPCWTITCHDDGTASLHPSVWRKKDCGVHFWFKRGRVRWA